MTVKKTKKLKTKTPEFLLEAKRLAAAVEKGRKLTDQQCHDIFIKLSGVWKDDIELFETFIRLGVLEPRHRKLLKKKAVT